MSHTQCISANAVYRNSYNHVSELLHIKSGEEGVKYMGTDGKIWVTIVVRTKTKKYAK